MAKKAPYTIGIDQREKLPYSFECMREAAELPYETQMHHLPTGDYVFG